MKNQSFEALKSFPLLEYFLKSNLCMLYVVSRSEVNNPILQTGIHEVETHEGESSQVRDVKALITLRSGKKVELPTPKPHVEEKEEEETKKREEIKGKKEATRFMYYQRGLNVNKKAFLTEQQSTPEEEEGPEEVCIIDTLVEEHCWRRKEEILHLFIKEEEQKVDKEETPKLNLKPLPMELKYTYLEKNQQCPEKCLLEVLMRCKKVIGWQISDLKGISPLVCTHHIYMEEEAKPIRQPQRRLNPHLQEVVRVEVLKLLQAGIIYPISDSPWVSPTQVVPKIRDYCVSPSFYCFLDGYSDIFKLKLMLKIGEDHFHMSIRTYASEECLLVYAMHLQHSKDKCHFMVHQGIVLGHIISEKGIEVDKAKVELIVKLPPPTTVKGDAKFIWDERCQESFDQSSNFDNHSNSESS
ncbi:hypothetical protein AAG906_010397 [Vitis piasezkii]